MERETAAATKIVTAITQKVAGPGAPLLAAYAPTAPTPKITRNISVGNALFVLTHDLFLNEP
jgi:hypothetical protein